MKLKTFEQFSTEDFAVAGGNTSWSDTYKGKEITITLKDVNDYLDKKNVQVKEINPKSIEELLIKTERDPNRIESANLDYPVILSEKDGELIHILDGQHRIVKCLKNDIDKIKVRILNLNTAPFEYKYIFR